MARDRTVSYTPRRQVSNYYPTPSSLYKLRMAGRLVKKAYTRYTSSGTQTKKTKFASTPHQNPMNAQAKRASKRTKGSKNVRSIVHRKRPIKVSRPLRKKIQKVIDGDSFKGTYHATRFGTIGVTASASGGTSASVVKRENMGGYVNQFAYHQVHRNFDGNTRFWFAHPLQSTDTGGSDTAKLEPGSEWQFFSPLKILDAASVLWNDKAIERQYSTQIGNLNTVVQEANGAPVVGTAINPQIKGLKVHVGNSYVKFTMKNNSQRAMKVCVYNIVPKIKFPEHTPLETFENALIIESDGSNSAYMSAQSDGFTQQQTEEALLINPACEPNMLKSFSSSYKYEKTIIRIAPGETCGHSVQGPKGYTLDYSKLYDGGVNQQGLAYKGTTMFTMMSCQPDLAYATNNVGTTDANGRTGHFGPGTAASLTLADPISIQWDEVYRLSIPEIVGFKTANGAGGTMQVLNKKLPRRAFANFSNLTSADANPTYNQYDEENPGIVIPQSITN